jgi:hypothetical protein
MLGSGEICTGLEEGRAEGVDQSTQSQNPEEHYHDPHCCENLRSHIVVICFSRYSSKYNVQFNDADTHMAVLYDIELYREIGGGAIVENTSHGLQRNLQFMKEVSQKTGVHVIAGTGNSLIVVFIFVKCIVRNFAYIIILGYIYCRYKSVDGKLITLQIPHCMES